MTPQTDRKGADVGKPSKRDLPRAVADALKRVTDAKAELEAATDSLLEVAGDCPATADELVEMYWSVPEIPVAVLADRIGMTASQASNLGLWGSVTVGWCDAHGPILASSRTAVSDARRPAGLRCQPCLEARRTHSSAAATARVEAMRERIAGLKTMPYAEYLRTEHWADVRQAALRRARWRCQVCNSTGALDVHHRTYENRGSERSYDVIALCRPCHARHHGKDG